MMMRSLASFVGAVSVVLSMGCDRPSPPAPPPPRPPQPAPTAASSTASAVDGSAVDSGAAATVMSFEAEVEGALPDSLEAVAGTWTIGRAGDAKGVMVGGGKTSASYPLAVARAAAPTGDMRLSVRFYPIAGAIDQAAGIAFGIAPDGGYSGVRANALEDNLLYFSVAKGKRTVHDTVAGVATPSRVWHTLSVELRGTNLTVTVDDAKRFEKKLDVKPRGRVGLWSKADSKVLFDDFQISAL